MLAQLRLDLGANALPGITVVRIIGHWYCTPNNITFFDMDGRLGIVPGNVKDTTASLPFPYQDEGDFMWVDDMLQVHKASVTNFPVTKDRVIDCKAQRKVEEIDETVFGIFTNAGNVDLDIRIRVRMLLLLP